MLLLTAIDPFAGFLLFVFVGVLALLVFSAVLAGIIWLLMRLFVQPPYTFGTLFGRSFLINLPLTILLAANNAFGLPWVSKIRSWFLPMGENDKFQPVEIFLLWGLVLVLVSFALLRKKK